MTKRTGRPPLDPDDPSVKVTISLPAKQFDRYCAAARRQDLSLPEVLRRALYGHREITRKTRTST
jgi:hypothetical protein